MGDCIIRESSMQRGREDWATSGGKTRNPNDFCRQSRTEKTSLLGASSSPKAAGTKVKIRISKKQLEDLLKNHDVQGLSAHEVLALLTDAGGRFEAHRRSWTPALQSIPE